MTTQETTTLEVARSIMAKHEKVLRLLADAAQLPNDAQKAHTRELNAIRHLVSDFESAREEIRGLKAEVSRLKALKASDLRGWGV